MKKEKEKNFEREEQQVAYWCGFESVFLRNFRSSQEEKEERRVAQKISSIKKQKKRDKFSMQMKKKEKERRKSERNFSMRNVVENH